MTTLRLPDEIATRLEALARKTGRSKSSLAREAILLHLDDLEDSYVARTRLSRSGGRVTLEELEDEAEPERDR